MDQEVNGGVGGFDLNTSEVRPDLWTSVLSTIAAAVVGEMHYGIGNGPALRESDAHLIK